jgi:hypothetical protein
MDRMTVRKCGPSFGRCPVGYSCLPRRLGYRCVPTKRAPAVKRIQVKILMQQLGSGSNNILERHFLSQALGRSDGRGMQSEGCPSGKLISARSSKNP